MLGGFNQAGREREPCSSSSTPTPTKRSREARTAVEGVYPGEARQAALAERLHPFRVAAAVKPSERRSSQNKGGGERMGWWWRGEGGRMVGKKAIWNLENSSWKVQVSGEGFEEGGRGGGEMLEIQREAGGAAGSPRCSLASLTSLPVLKRQLTSKGSACWEGRAPPLPTNGARTASLPPPTSATEQPCTRVGKQPPCGKSCLEKQEDRTSQPLPLKGRGGRQ